MSWSSHDDWRERYLKEFSEWAQQLLVVVPEFLEVDQENRHLSWDEGMPLPYVYFSDVTYYLKPILEGPDQEELRRRLFEHIEVLAQSTNIEIKWVVADGMESLGEDRKWIHRARLFMGTETLRLSFAYEPKDWAHIRDATGISRVWWQLYYHVWYRRRFWWPPRWWRRRKAVRR